MTAITASFRSTGATWPQASKNTARCLLGCAIGDFGTIAFFQFTGVHRPTLAIMILAITNRLLTSIALETVILVRHTDLRTRFGRRSACP